MHPQVKNIPREIYEEPIDLIQLAPLRVLSVL